ncbi:hypothetical protein AJ88_27675 [Mesorhizobium amorphae CCBAU 01583]|nr:hypothetical protein AJ88_27675 [Mesorhizobium amorphae CCBAU 01583]
MKNKQFDAAAATDAHKKALADLDKAIADVKNGVPGAEGALKRLSQAHLDAAKAAIADAKAQVAHQQAVLDAVKLSADQSALGPMEKRLGVDIDPATEALVKANIQLAQATRELEEIQNRIDGKVSDKITDLRTDAAAGAAAIKDVGAAAADTAGKVENLGHQITVVRGGGGELTKQVFNVVDGVARAADEGKKAVDDLGAATVNSGAAIDGVSNEITNSIATIAPAAKEAASGFNSSLAVSTLVPLSKPPKRLSSVLNAARQILRHPQRAAKPYPGRVLQSQFGRQQPRLADTGGYREDPGISARGSGGSVKPSRRSGIIGPRRIRRSWPRRRRSSAHRSRYVDQRQHSGLAFSRRVCGAR